MEQLAAPPFPGQLCVLASLVNAREIASLVIANVELAFGSLSLLSFNGRTE